MKAFFTATGCAALALACQDAGNTTVSTGGTAGVSGSGTGGSAAGAGGQAGAAGAPGGSGGSAGSSGSGGSGGTAGSGGNAGSGGGTCTAPPASVSELTDGSIGAGAGVALEAVVASSQKFLVSASKTTGSCLWGFFVSAPGLTTTEANSGVMIVSYGDSAAPTADGGLEDCVAGTDAIPDDVQPGDVVDLVGKTDSYAPGDCATNVEQIQVRVEAECGILKSGTAAVPAPAVLTTATADKLANATGEAALHDQWGGVLVRLENVDALQDGDAGDIVGPFGVIKLQQTTLEVHDKLYYYDLSGAGPKDPAKGPEWSFPTHFDRIDGIVYQDYCTWTLAPRSKCDDHEPPSEDCQ